MGTIIGEGFAHQSDVQSGCAKTKRKHIHLYLFKYKIIHYTYHINIKKNGEIHMKANKLITFKDDIKAVFFDIDGTYYDQINQCILASNILAVKNLQERGYKVALASARPFSSAIELPILQDITWDGIVAAGGQEVYNHHYELIEENGFSKQELHEIFSIADKQHIPVYVVGDDCFFTMDSPLIEPFKKKFHLSTNTIHPYHGEKALLITLLMPIDFRYEPYFQHMSNVRIQYTGGTNTDLFPKNVTKPSGIHTLMNEWGLPQTAYMAFGDSGSDIEMMHDAMIGVCMENGSEKCKQIADIVCGRSDQDGIYNFLKTYGFI